MTKEHHEETLRNLGRQTPRTTAEVARTDLPLIQRTRLSENLRRAEEIATSHDPQGPRVSLEEVRASIAELYFLRPHEALPDPNGFPEGHPCRILTLCVAVLKNGFTVVGKAAPASPQNFDKQVGETLAYEDCLRQIWPLLGFLLRHTLSAVPPSTAALP